MTTAELKAAQARITENIERAKKGYEYRATPRRFTKEDSERNQMATNYQSLSYAWYMASNAQAAPGIYNQDAANIWSPLWPR